MKSTLLIIVTGSAALFSACTPTSTTTGNSSSVPAPQINELSNIPVGKPHPTGRKNMVISPYAPYNLIDVKGYHRGDAVGDPSTAQRDSSGKLIESTSKHFLIP